MMRKCFNCAEIKKGCNPDIKPNCELRIPLIWQLISSEKIGGFERCLRKLGMKIEPIGNDDFTIVMA